MKVTHQVKNINMKWQEVIEHRDAVGSSNTYGPTVKIGDEVCAQVMFVIGTDGSRTLSPQLEEEFTVCN